MVCEAAVGAEWHLENYSEIRTRKGGSSGQGRISGGGEKGSHFGCILNTEPMTLAVDFTRAKKERRVKNDCKGVASSLTRRMELSKMEMSRWGEWGL